MRKNEHGADIALKNNKCTTSPTFEFTVNLDNEQVNIFDHDMKIFESMKPVDNSTKMITIAGKVFEHPKEMLSVQEYITHFPLMNSLQKQCKVFVCYKVEPALRVRRFQFGETKIIMHTLIANNTFIRFNKYTTDQKDIIG